MSVVGCPASSRLKRHVLHQWRLLQSWTNFEAPRSMSDDALESYLSRHFPRSVPAAAAGTASHSKGTPAPSSMDTGVWTGKTGRPSGTSTGGGHKR